MYCISEQQIDLILDDIRRNGVELEDLQLNLLDHICCIIERELEEDGDFESFYRKTLQRFYKKELRELEEETINLLTFKNYYAMKKAMYISGAISVAAFIIGSFFKLMFWPGVAAILIFGILFFSLVFLPLLFILKTREVAAARDKLIMGLGTVAGILYCLSALWLLMHWNGKHEIWLATLAFTFFVFLPAYFFTGIRKPETRVNTIVSTIIIIGVMGIQFTLTALRRPEGERIPPNTDEKVRTNPGNISNATDNN
jgi:hypothetical protein